MSRNASISIARPSTPSEPVSALGARNHDGIKDAVSPAAGTYPRHAKRTTSTTPVTTISAAALAADRSTPCLRPGHPPHRRGDTRTSGPPRGTGGSHRGGPAGVLTTQIVYSPEKPRTTVPTVALRRATRSSGKRRVAGAAQVASRSLPRAYTAPNGPGRSMTRRAGVLSGRARRVTSTALKSSRPGPAAPRCRAGRWRERPDSSGSRSSRAGPPRRR